VVATIAATGAALWLPWQVAAAEATAALLLTQLAPSTLGCALSHAPLN
jgi:hypothetical protein